MGNPLQPLVDWLEQAATWMQPLGLAVMVLGIFGLAFAILGGRFIASWRDKAIGIAFGVFLFGVVFKNAYTIAHALMG